MSYPRIRRCGEVVVVKLDRLMHSTAISSMISNKRRWFASAGARVRHVERYTPHPRDRAGNGQPKWCAGSFSTGGRSRPPSGRAFIGPPRSIDAPRVRELKTQGLAAPRPSPRRSALAGRAFTGCFEKVQSDRTPGPKQSSRESVARCSLCRWVPCPRHPAACSARRTKRRLTCKSSTRSLGSSASFAASAQALALLK